MRKSLFLLGLATALVAGLCWAIFGTSLSTRGTARTMTPPPPGSRLGPATLKEDGTGHRNPLPAIMDSGKWDPTQLLEAMKGRSTRGHALAEALGREELPGWLLERLRQGDFPVAETRRLGYLLRGLLTFWESLPYEPTVSRSDYLVAVIQAGGLADLPAGVLAFTWRKQRFLPPDGLRLVEGIRPSRIDGLKTGAMGAARADAYLALLEDALRGELDLGHEQTVLAYTGDPSSRVRSLAYELLLGSGLGGGWERLLAIFPQLSGEERSRLARALGEEADPELAGRLLLQLETRYGYESDLSGGWLALATRAPEQVGKDYLQLLGNGIRGPLPEGLDSLQDLAREGSSRNHIVTCYAVAADSSSQGLDWSILERAALEDWNPLVRAGAWEVLATSKDLDEGRIALQQLLSNTTSGELRIDGIEGEEHLVSGVSALIQNLGADQEEDLRTAILGLRIGEDARRRLLGELEAREGNDM